MCYHLLLCAATLHLFLYRKLLCLYCIYNILKHIVVGVYIQNKGKNTCVDVSTYQNYILFLCKTIFQLLQIRSY